MISRLGDPLVGVLPGLWMNPIVFPESPALKVLREMLEARGKTGWKAEGKAEALLAVLTARHLPMDAATSAHIEACTDSASLGRWIARAAIAATLDAVFAHDPDAE